MTVKAIAYATGTAVILAGCASNPARQAPSIVPPVNDCGASALQGQIGKPVTGDTASNVRVNGQRVQSHGDVRVIGPNAAMIQNFSAARLNLDVDTARNLVRQWCG